MPPIIPHNIFATTPTSRNETYQPTRVKWPSAQTTLGAPIIINPTAVPTTNTPTTSAGHILIGFACFIPCHGYRTPQTPPMPL
jgi:hypothetical protein